MALLYEDLARGDLVDAARYAVLIEHPDPLAYVAALEARMLTMHDNKNPGVVGRTPGTMEWILLPTDYIAVVKWTTKTDVRVYRVLPSKKMKEPRHKTVAGRADARSGTRKIP